MYKNNVLTSDLNVENCDIELKRSFICYNDKWCVYQIRAEFTSVTERQFNNLCIEISTFQAFIFFLTMLETFFLVTIQLQVYALPNELQLPPCQNVGEKRRKKIS